MSRRIDPITMMTVAALAGAGLLLYFRRAPAMARPAPSEGFPFLAPIPEDISTWTFTPIKPPTIRVTYSRGELDAAMRDAENNFGLPPGLLTAVAERESSFRPEIMYCEILGAAGEQGMMQMKPQFHGEGLCDPMVAIKRAAGYLRENFNRFGSWHHAVMAYTWGPTVLEAEGYMAAPAAKKAYVDFIASRVAL